MSNILVEDTRPQKKFLKLEMLKYETLYNDFDCMTIMRMALTYLEIAFLDK